MQAIAAAAIAVGLPRLSYADEFAVRGVIDATFGGKPIAQGRVTITVPPLAESGNSVPLGVAVDSPMTEEDYVTRILVMAERNPRPRVIEALLTPDSGRAEFRTNIRLNGTQRLLAYAEMSDGSVWMSEARVTVTVGACEPVMITFPGMGGN